MVFAIFGNIIYFPTSTLAFGTLSADMFILLLGEVNGIFVSSTGPVPDVIYDMDWYEFPPPFTLRLYTQSEYCSAPVVVPSAYLFEVAYSMCFGENTSVFPPYL